MRRIRAGLVIVWPLLLACSRGPGDARPTAQPLPSETPPEGSTVLEPTPGAAIERAIGEDEVHRVSIPLSAPGTVELVAEQRAVDLELAVLGPEGAPLVVTDRTGPGGTEHATWVAEAPETYRVEVRTWHGSGAAGGYALRFAGLRATTERDRVRAEAGRLFAAAEKLRAREDRESCRRAVVRYREALEVVRRLGDRRQEAEVLQRLAWVHRKYLEERRPAVAYYTDALALFEALGEQRHAASALNNLGRVRFDLGEPEGAVDAWNRALAILRRLGDPAGEAYSLGNLAVAHRHLGDVQRALGAYDRSLEALRAAGDRAAEGRALHNRGRFYRLLGEDRQALADLEAALAIARDVGGRRLEAAALTAIGRIHHGRGALESAREALESAFALQVELGDRSGRAAAERSLGSLLADLGRGEEAAALTRRALETFRELGAVREAAGASLALGELSLAAGRPDEALVLLRRALGAFREIRDPFGEVETLFTLARCERARGDLRAALALTEEALDGVEAVRGRLGSYSLRTSFFAARQDHYELHVDVLMDLHARRPDAGYDRRALEASERSRVRSLLDLLAESGVAPAGGADPALVAEKHALERRMALLEQERLRLAAAAPPERVAALEARLDELVRSYRALRGRIRASHPRQSALTGPPTLRAAEIQRLLEPGSLLLEIHLGARRSVLWAVTPRSVASFELPSRPVVEAAARRAHELLVVSHLREYREASARALAELSAMILGPLAHQLDGNRRLLVSPAGALRLVPFAALPAPGSAGRVLLGDRHEIVTVPSASALAVLREQAARRASPPGLVAVFADPVFEVTDPRLEGTGRDSATRHEGPLGTVPVATAPGDDVQGRLRYTLDEAAAILRLAAGGRTYRALGFEATREAALRPELGEYQVVHFATHGALDGEHPELSRLVFSRFGRDGRPRQAALFAHEVYDLDLPVHLVVLSACQTALGKEMRGEGLVGLTQGFFHAGAERVLVSLWRVDDRATAELMARFYDGLFARGLAPPAALRRAQRAVRSEPGWGAPYYWAGFVLQGEWL